MSNMTDGLVYADNTNFKAKETKTESNSPSYDNPWTVTAYTSQL